MRTILIIAILLSFSVVSFAQNPLGNFRDGNRQFRDGNFNNAEILFRRGLEYDNDIRGRFNLGNTLYRQGEFEQSAELFEQLSHDNRLSRNQRAEVLHNLGNSNVQIENFENAINSYKEAMKLNPNDDTRHNLAYALERLQMQQQEQQQDQNQQQGNQDQDQQQQGQQFQQNQGDQQRDQRQGTQPHELQQGDAERMLNAMERQERNTLDRRRQQNVQQRGTQERNW